MLSNLGRTIIAYRGHITRVMNELEPYFSEQFASDEVVERHNSLVSMFEKLKRASSDPGGGGGTPLYGLYRYLEIVDVLSLYKTPNKHICSVLFCSIGICAAPKGMVFRLFWS